MGLGNGTLTMRGNKGLFLGDDGSEVIKRHAWFRGVDWESGSFLPFSSSCSSSPLSFHFCSFSFLGRHSELCVAPLQQGLPGS
jgi:hypothetical protein